MCTLLSASLPAPPAPFAYLNIDYMHIKYRCVPQLSDFFMFFFFLVEGGMGEFPECGLPLWVGAGGEESEL